MSEQDIPRQAIADALEALIATATWQNGGDDQSWQQHGQRLIIWTDSQQPAFYLVEHDEIWAQKTGMPYRVELQYKVVVYQDTARDTSVAGAVLNRTIQTAIETVLRPVPADPGFHSRRNTLSGLAHHVFIFGQLFKDGGDLDGQGVMVIPISVLVP